MISSMGAAQPDSKDAEPLRNLPKRCRSREAEVVPANICPTCGEVKGQASARIGQLEALLREASLSLKEAKERSKQMEKQFALELGSLWHERERLRGDMGSMSEKVEEESTARGSLEAQHAEAMRRKDGEIEGMRQKMEEGEAQMEHMRRRHLQDLGRVVRDRDELHARLQLLEAQALQSQAAAIAHQERAHEDYTWGTLASGEADVPLLAMSEVVAMARALFDEAEEGVRRIPKGALTRPQIGSFLARKQGLQALVHPVKKEDLMNALEWYDASPDQEMLREEWVGCYVATMFESVLPLTRPGGGAPSEKGTD